MPRIPRLLGLGLLFILAVAVAQPAAGVAAAQASSPSGPATPGPIVAQAFNLLMDRFVIPPASGDVLNGGWEGGLTFLRERGAPDVPEERPTFTNERESDWRAFADGYARLAAAAGALAPGTAPDGTPTALDNQSLATQPARIQDVFREAHGEQAASRWAEEHNRHLLDRAIVRGMALAMRDGHTYYLTPEELQTQTSRIRDNFRYAGIGVTLNQERRVTEIFEESPAEAGGVRPGDQIVAVDGAPVEELTPVELSQRIRGEPNTSVELTIRREGVSEPVVLRLTRAEVKVGWLAWRMLDERIGYLKLRTFPTPDALGAFREAMAHFEAMDIAALVIDVRGNGGGVVETGVEVASRFVRNGPLFQRQDRFGGERTVTAFGDYWGRDVPIAVLTDGNSGSMSEILASALRENGVAHLIGTRTAGNVAGTTPYPLADGSGLAVTGWVIKSGLGQPLNGIGVEPDQTVELDPALLAAGRDNQLEAALAYVRAEVAARSAAPPDARVRPVALPAAA